MSGRDFPEEAILIARGKYSTLASERREALKALQDDMSALANYAHRILRAASDRTIDQEFMRSEIESASQRIGSAHLHMQSLVYLEPHLAALKPLAWGKGEPE